MTQTHPPTTSLQNWEKAMEAECRWYRDAYDHYGTQTTYLSAMRRAITPKTQSAVSLYQSGDLKNPRTDKNDKSLLPNIGIGHTGPTRKTDPEMPEPSNGLIVIDIDKMPTEEAANNYRLTVIAGKRPPWVVDAFVTVSKKGLKIIAATDITSHAYHKTAHKKVVDALVAHCGKPDGSIDMQCGSQIKQNTMFVPDMSRMLRAHGRYQISPPEHFQPLHIDLTPPTKPDKQKNRAENSDEFLALYEARKEEAKLRCGIEETYTRLGGTTPTGHGNVCCILHDDKTPSMALDPNSNLFHCFGCGKGGDQIHLFQFHRNITDTGEAISQFCDWVGVPEVQLPTKPKPKGKTKPWTLKLAKSLLKAIPPTIDDNLKRKAGIGACDAIQHTKRTKNALKEWLRKSGKTEQEILESTERWITEHAEGNTGITRADLLEIAKRYSPDSEAVQDANTETFEVEEPPPENFHRRTKAIGVNIRFNKLSNKMEASYQPGKELAGEKPDVWFVPERHIIDRWCGDVIVDGESPKPSIHTYYNWLRAGATINTVDPMLDYLESLPPYNPEDESLVMGLARHLWPLCKKTHPPGSYLPQYALWFFLSGVVSRTYEPGATHHTSLVLQGPQGIGKSTMLRKLVPEKSMFVETSWATGHDTDKKMLEVCAGALIVELAEAVALNRSDVNQLKSWLARDADTVRLAYAHDAITIPRRFVISITTNDATPLPFDASGNRRFLVLSLADIESRQERQEWRNHAVNYIRANRDKIWAEVKYRYLNNEPAYPEAEKYYDISLCEEIDIVASNSAWKSDIVEDVLDLPHEDKVGKTAREIYAIIRPGRDYDNDRPPPSTQIGKAMKKSRYTLHQIKIEGKQIRVYHKLDKEGNIIPLEEYQKLGKTPTEKF